MKETKKKEKGGGFLAVNILLLVLTAIEIAALVLVLTGKVRVELVKDGANESGGMPVITGVSDLEITAGGTVSYRSGVSARDGNGAAIPFEVDASAVNTEVPGVYPVIYGATDGRGRYVRVIARVTVLPPASPDDTPPALETLPGETSGAATEPEPDTSVPVTEPEPDTSVPVTEPEPPDTSPAPAENGMKARLDEIGREVLSGIITDGMTEREKAEKIFVFVNTRMKYVSTSDKSDWVNAAYTGYTQKKGDCFNYFALSKELLTLAGIPSVDLVRVGGNSAHYWQLVNVGDGWYHFDACPHPRECPFRCFMRTEAEVRDYSVKCAKWRKNYYVYDYDGVGVYVEGTPGGNEG